MTDPHSSVVPTTYAARPSRGAFYTGWALTVLPAVALATGGVIDVLKVPMAVEGLTKAGYAESTAVPLGLVTVACAVLYLVPQTAVLGALLLTAYLGGAVATHVRLGDPLAKMLVPVVFATVLWIALLLRDRRLRVLVPIRQV